MKTSDTNEEGMRWGEEGEEEDGMMSDNMFTFFVSYLVVDEELFAVSFFFLSRRWHRGIGIGETAREVR